ncbi:MAG: hypothetical protein V3W37_10555 [Candidatus Binatia bacterium]
MTSFVLLGFPSGRNATYQHLLQAVYRSRALSRLIGIELFLR